MINGQYTPLNLNCLGQLVSNNGLRINSAQLAYVGVSTTNTSYTTRGSIYTGTILDRLADVTSLAYSKIGGSPGIQQSTYNSLVNMGSTTIPALGNSKPATYTNTYTGEMTKYGWLRLIAYQAYTEFNVNGGNSYSDFLNTFATCDGFLRTSNSLIKNYSSATTFQTTTFSNMSDLITSDITGVSLSTLYWGQDLIASGRAIDLSRISSFGLPSNLLRTMSTNHALTASVNVALVAANFTSTEIDNIIAGAASIEQEKRIYSAFVMVQGTDLRDVCVMLNCQTYQLVTLADLLDPKKLFPNSYKTLTYPKYNSELGLPTNSRTYYRIYLNDAVDTALTPTIGLRLQAILPSNIAVACDAFSISMLQIKNIQSMNIEKFSQVVTNLENVSGMETGSANFPINPDIAAGALTIIAKGTGPNGTYSTCDFFGAVTDLHYDFNSFKVNINALNTVALRAIYEQMYGLLAGAGPYETELLTLIASANTAIGNIQTNSAAIATLLNTNYSTLGTKLTKEQNARSEALPHLADITTSTRDVYSFIDNLNEFAVQTQDYGPALVLESIADTTTMGGNSLIGSMREIRNSARLGLTGGKLDSGVDNTPLILPRISGTTARQSPIDGYTPNTNVADLPIVTGAANIPGSFAGSPEVRLIPANLSVFNTGISSSILTPSEALDEVIKCNCTCWDNLQ